MPKIKSLKEIMKEMKESFDKNPKNWKVLAGKTPNSYNDLFFCQSNDNLNNLWQIKAEKMSPFEILGVGTKVHDIDEEITLKILEKGQNPNNLFGMVVPQEKGGITTAMGPMKHSDNSVKEIKEDISNSNSLLEKLLKKRLKELIEKEHPGRFNMFE